MARGAGACGRDAARRGRMGGIRDAGRARGHPLSVPHRRRPARARSGRALPARRRARRERGRRSPRPRVDRHHMDRAAPGAPRVLRAPRGRLHRGRHLRGRGRAARPPGRARRHRGGADAAGRLPRPPRLGLRRRAPLRARGELRPARGSQVPGGRRARARPRRLPRRRLQPLRARGQLPPSLRARLLQPAPSDAVGRRGQLRRARFGGGARVHDPQCALLDRGVSPRRPAPRRGQRDRGRVANAPAGGARPARWPTGPVASGACT